MSRIAPNHLPGFDDVDISAVAPPPSALLSSTPTAYHPPSPSPLHDFPAPANSSHQRTLTGTFLDNLQRATTTLKHHTSQASLHSLHSPTKSLASFIPTRSPLESSASQPKIRALQNWFSGSSAPVRFGLPTRSHPSSDSESEPESDSGDEYDSRSEDDNDHSDDDEEQEREKNKMFANIFARTPSPTRSSGQSPSRPETTETPTKAPSQPTASSKFAWLLSAQKNAVMPSSAPSIVYHNSDDELLNLNISQSLFPYGPADPLAPSSFHDLLTNAEVLLSRYQASYRELSASLVDARSEQSAQEDELDEADTRVRHLKIQLETMAARANKQDEQMQKLVKDLAFERKARQEDEEARKQSVTLVKQSAKAEHGTAQDTTPRRRNRTSNSNISIDSGFESECETDAASNLSRDCLCSAPREQSSVLENDNYDTTPRAKQTQTLQRRSTYDKVRDGTVNLVQGGWGCTNCEGGAQAAVWGRLAKEREENRTLRHQVEKLEEAIEGALNVVDGPWRI